MRVRDSWDSLRRRAASGQAPAVAASGSLAGSEANRPRASGWRLRGACPRGPAGIEWGNAGRLAMERAAQTFKSDVQQLAGIRSFVRAACERAWGAGGADEIARLELALAEAAANVILHGYQGEA